MCSHRTDCDESCLRFSVTPPMIPVLLLLATEIRSPRRDSEVQVYICAFRAQHIRLQQAGAATHITVWDSYRITNYFFISALDANRTFDCSRKRESCVPPHFLLIKNAILTAFNEEHHNIVDSRILIGHNIPVSRILIGLGDKGSYI